MKDFKQSKIITDGNLAGSIESSVVDITMFNGYSITAVFTGAPVGTLKLQCSNDENSSGTNYEDVPNSSQAVSAAGSHTWNVSDAQYGFVKVVYTRSSGTGTMNAKATLKG